MTAASKSDGSGRVKWNEVMQRNELEPTTVTQVAPKLTDPNAEHLVVSYSLEGVKVRVYVMDPGTCFHGFGGSRHALGIRRKASLIIRTISLGVRDMEYNLNDTEAWKAVREGWAIAVHNGTAD